MLTHCNNSGWLAYNRTVLSRLTFYLAVTAIVLPSQTSVAQDSLDIPVRDIMQRAVANQEQTKDNLRGYVFRREMRLQEMNLKGDVAGEYYRASEVAWDSSGSRAEKSLGQSTTLVRINLTRQDMQDLQDLENFPLGRDIDHYDIRFVERERINELPAYVLELKPKNATQGQRYFTGKVWVEEPGFHIIRVAGKFSDVRDGGGENLFPQVDLYRELVDGNWFPDSITAVDTLRFSSGPVGIRLTVRFENYWRR
jgi:hypothetical protein